MESGSKTPASGERNHSQQSPTRLLLSVEEAAELLGLGRTAVYGLIMRRQIISIKIGRSRRIPQAALEEFIGRQMPPVET